MDSGLFKEYDKLEDILLNQCSYVFKDYRGYSEWKEEFIWCYAFDLNQYSYFSWE